MRDIGCDEWLVGGSVQAPLSPAEVGPTWKDHDVWVDSAAAGVQSGAQTDLFDTVQEGVHAALWGGTVYIQAGSYAEALTTKRKMTLRGAQGGTVTIGSSPP